MTMTLLDSLTSVFIVLINPNAPRLNPDAPLFNKFESPDAPLSTELYRSFAPVFNFWSVVVLDPDVNGTSETGVSGPVNETSEGSSIGFSVVVVVSLGI